MVAAAEEEAVEQLVVVVVLRYRYLHREYDCCSFLFSDFSSFSDWIWIVRKPIPLLFLSSHYSSFVHSFRAYNPIELEPTAAEVPAVVVAENDFP